MKRFTRPGSVLRVAAFALACLLGSAATAHAQDSITVTFGPDPTEEVPVPIRMSWTTGYPNPYVVVTVKPRGLRGCGATHAIDDPHSTDVLAWRGGFVGGRTRTWTFAAPGSRVLCGYLQRSTHDPAPLSVTGPITLTTRSARASVGITAPSRVAPRQAFALSVSVTAELPRYVIVTHKAAGRGTCAASHALDDPISRDVLVAPVQGTQARTRTLFAPRTPGPYLLCAYVLESSQDPAPEAVASGIYVVGSDRCRAAKAALARAAQAVKTADASAGRNHRSYKRYRTLARHARGERRRRLLSLARREWRRYRSALLVRHKARAALEIARSNATTACPSARR